MKKPFLLLGSLVLLIAFAGVYQSSKNERLNSARLSGAPKRELLFDNLPAGDIRGLRVKDKDNEAIIKVVENRWVVVNRGNYPASFDKLTKVVARLAGVRILDKQVLKDDMMGRVNLMIPGEGEPAQAGRLVQLLGANGEVISEIIIGNELESTGGANSHIWMGAPETQKFVRMPKDENTVWLINEPLGGVMSDPSEWLDKQFVSMDRAKRIEVTHPDAANSWTVERKSDNLEFRLVPDPVKQDQLDITKVEGITNVLSQTSFVDVVKPEEVKKDFFKNGLRLKIHTFDHFTYEAQIIQKKPEQGNAEEQVYVSFTVQADIKDKRVEVAGETPEAKKSAEEAFQKEKKRLAAKLAKEKKMEGWVFVVSDLSVGPILKPRKDIVAMQAAPKQEATKDAAKIPFLPADSAPPAKPQPKPEAAPAKPEAAPAKAEAEPAKP